MTIEGAATIPDVGIRIKGSDTFLRAKDRGKWSFKIDFDRFTRGQHLGSLSTLNLHNGITDPGFMNESLGYRLYRDAGVAAPRTTYARVFVHVPGVIDHQPYGVYTAVEDVDASFVQDRFHAASALFKPFSRLLFPDFGPSFAAYRDAFNPKSSLTEHDAARVVELCRLVAAGSDAAFAARIGRVLDLESFSRFLAVAVWLADPDSALDGGKNFYLVLPRPDAPFVFVPWDLDHAFGQFPVVDAALLQELDIRAPARRGDNRLVTRLLRLPDFRASYLDALRSLVTTDADPARIAAWVDASARVLRPAVAGESPDVLRDFDRAVAGLPTPRAGNGGIPIKPFAIARTRSVTAQLARP
jgi:spore coat protein CotH